MLDTICGRLWGWARDAFGAYGTGLAGSWCGFGGFYVHMNVAMIVLPWTIVSVSLFLEAGALFPACFVLIVLGDV